MAGRRPARPRRERAATARAGRGISIHDNGRHDRIGYSWVIDEKPAELCQSSAPF